MEDVKIEQLMYKVVLFGLIKFVALTIDDSPGGDPLEVDRRVAAFGRQVLVGVSQSHFGIFREYLGYDPRISLD